jgi:hypothetical protein
MLPSFSASNLKPPMSIFLEKAFQLRDKLVEISQAAASAKGNEEKGTGETKGAEVEVMAWLGRATMDIIGLAVSVSRLLFCCALMIDWSS